VFAFFAFINSSRRTALPPTRHAPRRDRSSYMNECAFCRPTPLTPLGGWAIVTANFPFGGTMRRPVLLNVFVLFATILLPVSAAAQTGAASLTGIVTDQSGAAVPGATVTATSQTTNVIYSATSNDSGNYNITSLPVGTYVLKAELTGFKT